MSGGGFIEGLRKCYKGKNLPKKHVFLYILAFLMTLYQYSNKEGLNQAILPFLCFLYIVSAVLFLLYFTHFLHNAIKFTIWKDTRTDLNRVNAMDIMPEVNADLFSHFGAISTFYIVWGIITFVLVYLMWIFCKIPLLGLFIFTPISLIVFLCYLISINYIISGFAKNYKTSGNCSPFLILSLVPKVFTSTFILGLKYIVFEICCKILQVGILIVLGIPIYKIAPQNAFLISAAIAAAIYIEMVSILIFYYAIAGIYYRKVELEREI